MNYKTRTIILRIDKYTALFRIHFMKGPALVRLTSALLLSFAFLCLSQKTNAQPPVQNQQKFNQDTIKPAAPDPGQNVRPPAPAGVNQAPVTPQAPPPPPRITHYNKSDIHSEFVLAARRASFKKYLIEKTIRETFSGPLNPNTQYKFEDACLSATQFLIKNSYSQRGFDKMFEQYFRLDRSARLALLTAVYGIFPATYNAKIKEIMPYEKDPKCFAIAALYQFRMDSSIQFKNNLLSQMRRQFANSYQIDILNELTKYLQQYRNQILTPTPNVQELFRYQQLWKQKTIYSFQRWDRNYNGLCIVQLKNGRFARDSSGKLFMFRQLARSGSGLPYFITNGNTPQGVYRIAGARVSINKLIGPTPTLQSIIPFQSDSVYYRDLPQDGSVSPLDNYKKLLPPSWQSYPPMQESFYAGKVGRRYIVIHGSTLDKGFFESWPFYPNSPTDGCLATLESWDESTGRIIHSDQLQLVNTFLKSPDNMGILEVINLDNKKENVTPAEIEALVHTFESTLPAR